MSFYGKTFKKVKTENAMDFIGKLDLSEQTLSMLRTPESLTTFMKNADGTLQYVITDSTGQVVVDQKVVLDAHVDFRASDMQTQVKFHLKGDVILTSHIHLPDGKVVHMDRYFEGNNMKLGYWLTESEGLHFQYLECLASRWASELYIKGTDEKATVYYDAV